MNFILAIFGVIFSILTMLFAFLVHPFGWVVAGVTTGVVTALKGYGLMSILFAIGAAPVTFFVGLVGGAICAGLAAVFVGSMK